MARFRHTGGEWDREDVERWALFRQLPTALRTALEVPTPQLTMDELLNKADDLFTTLPMEDASMLKKLATCSTSGKTKLVSRVTVGNARITRRCQPGDWSVSITAGHWSATRFARPVGC